MAMVLAEEREKEGPSNFREVICQNKKFIMCFYFTECIGSLIYLF
jgi:hypothetical protein